MRLRPAGTRERPDRAQLLQQRIADGHRVSAAVRRYPHHPGGGRPLLQRRGHCARPPRGFPRQRREEAVVRRPRRPRPDDPHRRLSVHGHRRDAGEGAGFQLRRPRHLQGLHSLQRHDPRFSEQAAPAAQLGRSPARHAQVDSRPRGVQMAGAPRARPRSQFRSAGRGGGQDLGHGGRTPKRSSR